MKKKHAREISQYGQPLLLYPGLSLRIGSMMQIGYQSKTVKKEAVDKFVDKPRVGVTPIKNKHARPDCSKNKQ